MSPSASRDVHSSKISARAMDSAVLNALVKARRTWQTGGLFATALAITEVLFRPILRLRRRLLFMAPLDHPRSPSDWEAGEHLLVVGADNLKDLTPRVSAFLESSDQQEDLRGVQNGNRLFLVTDGTEGLHRGYLRLVDAGASDRKAVFFGLEAVPEIRSCETAPRARGKGLYRRVLNEQLRYLQGLGYDRAALYVMGENTASIKGATAAGFKLHRTLNDWILFHLVVLQHVREAGSTRWRVFLR